MRTTTLASLTLAAATLLPTAGCKTVNTVEADKPNYHANYIKDHRVETDGFLADKASIQEIRQGTVQGDLMKVDVEIVNDKLWDGNIAYKFEWFDDQGMPVPTQSTGYTARHLVAQEPVSLTSVAPTPACKDFRLLLRRSQKGDHLWTDNGFIRPE